MDEKISRLRERVKKSSRKFMLALDENLSVQMCMLCGERDNLTREHVIPQWAFKGDAGKVIVNKTNDQPMPYVQLTIPACQSCNSELLGVFEESLKKMFQLHVDDGFLPEEIDNIIWWLEYIGFKLQVADLRSKYLRHRKMQYMPEIADVPIAFMRGNKFRTWNQIFTGLNKARNRLIEKQKKRKRINLHIFHTTNKELHFFHKTNEFIFIELPQVGCAFFLFYHERFNNRRQSYRECWRLIETVYHSE
jgi:hypothetical protein